MKSFKGLCLILSYCFLRGHSQNVEEEFDRYDYPNFATADIRRETLCFNLIYDYRLGHRCLKDNVEISKTTKLAQESCGMIKKNLDCYSSGEFQCNNGIYMSGLLQENFIFLSEEDIELYPNCVQTKNEILNIIGERSDCKTVDMGVMACNQEFLVLQEGTGYEHVSVNTVYQFSPALPRKNICKIYNRAKDKNFRDCYAEIEVQKCFGTGYIEKPTYIIDVMDVFCSDACENIEINLLSLKSCPYGMPDQVSAMLLLMNNEKLPPFMKKYETKNFDCRPIQEYIEETGNCILRSIGYCDTLKMLVLKTGQFIKFSALETPHEYLQKAVKKCKIKLPFEFYSVGGQAHEADFHSPNETVPTDFSCNSGVIFINHMQSTVLGDFMVGSDYAGSVAGVIIKERLLDECNGQRKCNSEVDLLEKEGSSKNYTLQVFYQCVKVASGENFPIQPFSSKDKSVSLTCPVDHVIGIKKINCTICFEPGTLGICCKDCSGHLYPELYERCNGQEDCNLPPLTDKEKTGCKFGVANASLIEMDYQCLRVKHNIELCPKEVTITNSFDGIVNFDTEETSEWDQYNCSCSIEGSHTISGNATKTTQIIQQPGNVSVTLVEVSNGDMDFNVTYSASEELTIVCNSTSTLKTTTTSPTTSNQVSTASDPSTSASSRSTLAVPTTVPMTVPREGSTISGMFWNLTVVHLILIIVCPALVVIILVVIIYVCCCRKREKDNVEFNDGKLNNEIETSALGDQKVKGTLNESQQSKNGTATAKYANVDVTEYENVDEKKHKYEHVTTSEREEGSYATIGDGTDNSTDTQKQSQDKLGETEEIQDSKGEDTTPGNATYAEVTKKKQNNEERKSTDTGSANENENENGSEENALPPPVPTKSEPLDEHNDSSDPTQFTENEVYGQ